MNDEQIKHMVNRFLMWRLPENFNPDGGISFKRVVNENTAYPRKSEPVGTNLFDYTQAKEMVSHMIDGMPSAKWTCPDCDYDSMPYPPEDYNICPKCMVEFGNDDRKSKLLERLAPPAEDQNCPRCGSPWSEHHGDKHAQGYVCPKRAALAEKPLPLENQVSMPMREWLEAKRLTLTPEQLWAVESYIVMNFAALAEKPAERPLQDLDSECMGDSDHDAFNKWWDLITISQGQRHGGIYKDCEVAFYAGTKHARAERPQLSAEPDENCNRCGFPWSEHRGDKHAQGYVCPKPRAERRKP